MKISQISAYRFLIGFMLFVIIFLTVTIYHYQYTQASTKESSIFPLLSPLRQSLDQKYFVINFNKLRNELTNIAQQEAENQLAVSIYFEYINTGASISINREQKFYPASLTKVPTAMIVYKQVEDGVKKWTDKFTITKEVKNSSWGNLYKIPDGSQVELDDLVTAMLVQSDNTAHQVLYHAFGSKEANAYGEAVGLEELFDNEGKTTAREYARIFRSLYTSNYLSAKDSQELLDLLSQKQTRNYLVSGLPNETIFSHKIGRDVSRSIALDVGIVYIPNKPYLIMVVLDGQKNPEYLTDQKIEELMHKISQLIYQETIKE